MVNRADPAKPQLTNFAAVLEAGVDQTLFEAVNQRLAELEVAIADAEDEVEINRERLRRAQAAYQQSAVQAQKAVVSPQNWTLALGLLTGVVLFLVVFVLEKAAWYFALALAIMLSLWTARSYQRWQRIESQARAQLRDSRQAIEQAEALLSESLARREDRALEQELRQKQVESYTTTPENNA